VKQRGELSGQRARCASAIFVWLEKIRRGDQVPEMPRKSAGTRSDIEKAARRVESLDLFTEQLKNRPLFNIPVVGITQCQDHLLCQAITVVWIPVGHAPGPSAGEKLSTAGI
jgi:hypothetical protein